MRAQVTVLSAFLAAILVIIGLFTVFIHFIPLANTKASYRSVRFDIERTVLSRTNWTARELVEELIAEYSPDYVNVSVRIYDVLDNNKLVYCDQATYTEYGIRVEDLQVYCYVITSLARNGYYIEYVIEVGYK